MADTTAGLRRMMIDVINREPASREVIEMAYGEDDVWDTKELQKTFEVVGFAAPFCMVKKKSTGETGTIMFQHTPRFYFGFVPTK